MPAEEWVKTLEDGQELPEDTAFMIAQIERNEVVYSVLLNQNKKATES